MADDERDPNEREPIEGEAQEPPQNVSDENAVPDDAPETEDVPAAPEDTAGEDAPGEGIDPDSPAPEVEGAEQLAAAAEQAEQAEEQPAAEGEQRPPRRERGKKSDGSEEEVIPGAHLEPDIVFEEQQRAAPDDEFGDLSQYEAVTEPEEAPAVESEEAAPEPAPVAHTPVDLAADARYIATGKRKSAVARVILRPGEGTYTVNGRHLDEYFPRVRLQRLAQQPLETANYQNRMDVVARIHGGGVSAQATALRHGIARALVEADPNLRSELKRRGYLTRDPRVKERKKAGLKKARKRPQFSKR
jgi:small subunit ribosomal protein S9